MWFYGTESPGETITLTEGVDWAGPEAPEDPDDYDEVFTSTDEDDDIEAPVVVDAFGVQQQTWQANDVLDGAGGDNTLNAVVIDAALDFSAAAAEGSMDNIQTLNLRSGTAASTVTFTSAFSDIEAIWSDRAEDSAGGNGNLTVNAVQNAITIGLNRAPGEAGVHTYTVQYEDDVLDSTTAEQAFAFTRSGTEGNPTAVVVDRLAGGADTDEITTITADVEGSNFIDLNIAGGNFAGALTEMTFTGSGNLTLTPAGTEFDTVEDVTASALEGDLDIDMSGNTEDLTFVGSQGDTRLVLDDGELDASDDIDLGTGTNTLALEGVATGALLEEVKVDGTTADPSDVENANYIEFVDAINLGQAATTLDLEDLDYTKVIFTGGVDTDNAANDELIIDNFAQGEAVSFIGATGDTNPIGLTIADPDGEFTIELGDAAHDFGDITLAKVTDLVIDDTASESAAANTIDDLIAANLETLTINLGEEDLAVTDALDSADLTTITASGEGDVTFDIDAAATSITSIDLTDHEGAAAIDASAAAYDAAATINVGEGDLDYTAETAEGVRETLKFVGDDIGTVNVAADFTSGPGANSDRLDFSAFDGVDSTEDLDIVNDGADVEITAADDQFDGTITLTGIGGEWNATDTFIF